MRLTAYSSILTSFLVMCLFAAAQDSAPNAPTSNSVDVPRLIKFSGVAKDDAGKPVAGFVGITFALYKEGEGGAPLWLETQNVQADAAGRYTVMLGVTRAEGLPLDVFTGGEARWLGVRREGQSEQPRVLLVSVPYALKAHEAETLAGRSISEFVLNDSRTVAAGDSGAAAGAGRPTSARPSTPPPPSGPTTFTGSNTTQIVGVTQSGSGTGLSATSTTHAALAGKITGTTNTAVYGLASNTSSGSNAAGVTGQSNTQLGPGVQGVTTSSKGIGVQGVVNAKTGGVAVQGLNNATSGANAGVSGQSASVTAGSAGVVGNEVATTGQVFGMAGSTSSTTNYSAGVTGFEGAITGVVYGVSGGTNSTTQFSSAVSGYEGATTGQVSGVGGAAASTTAGAAGVSGYESATTGAVSGVSGFTASTTAGAAGVNGFENSASGAVFGVVGGTNSHTNGAAGVAGYDNATTGVVAGVSGSTASATGAGVSGNASASGSGSSASGVAGTTASASGSGVVGNATATSGPAIGVQGITASPNGAGGAFTNSSGGTSAVIVANGGGGASLKQIFSVDASGNGVFAGNLSVKGTVTKGGGSFKIDHPLDPANKYLSHSFVESPDMMNVYNGNITTDKHGLAIVVLPDYFDALNRDFRYQLTVIGRFAQAIVARKIADHRFVIRTSKPRVEVSWQVTGIRHDSYANAYRIAVEEAKPPQERGRYLHPELFGASDEQSYGAGVMAQSSVAEGSASPVSTEGEQTKK